jgi:hypothetical protein
MSRGTQGTFEALQLETEIEQRGYSEFRHNIPDEQIENLVERYADFTLNLPDPEFSTMDAMLPTENLGIQWRLDELDRSRDDQEEWHKYRTNTVGIGKPDGYTNRSFQERALRYSRGLSLPPEDPKEFYHFTPRHWAKMSNNHAEYSWGHRPSEVQGLEEAFRPIHQSASKLILKVAGIIEDVHPEIRRFFSTESLANSPVRLLFYHPSQNLHLGAGHYDKASLTIQIAESHEGLRVASDKDAELLPVVRPNDIAVVFPGDGLARRFGPETPFRPGWHDIAKIDRLNSGRSVPPKAAEVCARWALIFFANGENFRNPNKSSMHTR